MQGRGAGTGCYRGPESTPSLRSTLRLGVSRAKTLLHTAGGHHLLLLCAFFGSLKCLDMLRNSHGESGHLLSGGCMFMARLILAQRWAAHLSGRPGLGNPEELQAMLASTFQKWSHGPQILADSKTQTEKQDWRGCQWAFCMANRGPGCRNRATGPPGHSDIALVTPAREENGNLRAETT